MCYTVYLHFNGAFLFYLLGLILDTVDIHMFGVLWK